MKSAAINTNDKASHLLPPKRKKAKTEEKNRGLMAAAGSGLAELYVMAKLHKEKIKKTMEADSHDQGMQKKKKKKGTSGSRNGYLSGMFKKVHPAGHLRSQPSDSA